MKNLIVLTFISLLLSACGDEKPKTFCKVFDVQCELDKEYQFLKVLEQPDSTVIDGYGMPIQENRWYFRSQRAETLIPADDNPAHGFSHNDFEYADQNYAHYRGSRMSEVPGDVKSAECKVGCKVVGATPYKALKVKLLLFGKRYIDVIYNGERPVCVIKETDRRE